jgi:LmbE family N-acetylglucosaminyl deacetylase
VTRAPLAARAVLVVAPHPDDEAIGAWALLRHFQRRGARMRVVIVSDGGASHPDSRRWPRDRLVQERRRETRRAMRSLGLPPSSIHFLALPDSRLASGPDALRSKLGAIVRRQPRSTLIVGPESGDAHADHRAVASALTGMRRTAPRRLGYHVWPEGAACGPRPCRLPLRGAAMAMKRRVVRSYRTQTGIITDARAGFAMTHRHLRAFVRPIERFAVIR